MENPPSILEIRDLDRWPMWHLKFKGTFSMFKTAVNTDRAAAMDVRCYDVLPGMGSPRSEACCRHTQPRPVTRVFPAPTGRNTELCRSLQPGSWSFYFPRSDVNLYHVPLY